MEAKEKNLQQQVQFWALVGPLMSLLTILVSFMKYSPMQYTFASVMIVAIPICWKWRMRGFAIAMGILMTLVAYQFVEMTFDQRIWIGGISLAFSLSLLSTALSFEEISSLVDAVQVESKSRLEHMLRLDEKFRQVSDQYQDEERQLKGQLQESEKEVVLYKNRVNASEKLSQVVREELAATHKRNEEILQELYDTRTKSLLTERKIQELEGELTQALAVPLPASFVEMEKLQGEHAVLKETLMKKEEALDFLKLQLEYREEELQKVKKESSQVLEAKQTEYSLELQTVCEHLESMQQRLQENEEQLDSLKLTIQERDQEFVIERQKLEEEQQRAAEQELVLHKLLEEAKAERERLLEQMQSQPQSEVAEKKVPKKETSALRQAEGRYKQLKQQFDEKSLVLDETRRALFHMQEDLLNLQRESEERKITEKSEVEVILEQHIKKMEEERKQLEGDHQQEIDDLHEIITSLSSKTKKN